MDKNPTWWQIFKLKLSMGKPLAPVPNLGQIDHSTVIRFKDYYVNIMEANGEIVNLGWSKDPHMFPDVNINDFLSVTPVGERQG